MKIDENSNKERINVTFNADTYNKIKLIAHKQNISMSEVCRRWIEDGLNGTLNVDNIDFLVPIIKEQLKSILDPSVNRLAALSAKTCVQAGTAAYLTAETISKFVPPAERMDFVASYESARKKAVHYMKNKSDSD